MKKNNFHCISRFVIKILTIFALHTRFHISQEHYFVTEVGSQLFAAADLYVCEFEYMEHVMSQDY